MASYQVADAYATAMTIPEKHGTPSEAKTRSIQSLDGARRVIIGLLHSKPRLAMLSFPKSAITELQDARALLQAETLEKIDQALVSTDPAVRGRIRDGALYHLFGNSYKDMDPEQLQAAQAVSRTELESADYLEGLRGRFNPLPAQPSLAEEALDQAATRMTRQRQQQQIRQNAQTITAVPLEPSATPPDVRMPKVSPPPSGSLSASPTPSQQDIPTAPSYTLSVNFTSSSMTEKATAAENKAANTPDQEQEKAQPKSPSIAERAAQALPYTQLKEAAQTLDKSPDKSPEPEKEPDGPEVDR